MYQYQVFPSPVSVPSAPKSVQRAVYLMYAGAVVSFISGIVGLVSLLTRAPGSPFYMHGPSGAQLPGAVSALGSALLYLVAVVSLAAPIVLWLWMAWKCKAGRSWARVLSTVFFGLATVVTLASGPYSAWGLVGAILGWLIGLGAVFLLWQRSSSSYLGATTHLRSERLLRG
ncbi:MAG: hypothetical protein J2P28_03975 [Actinobacteria bacterium]|nr:hypothetical protein [Actinomycetota bacterium]